MIVLLCDDLERLGGGIDLNVVERWLAERVSPVEVRRGAGACDRPERWLDQRLNGATRLVLGVCSRTPDRRELDARARRHGLDPLGIELLALGTYAALTHPRSQATEKAKLLLDAALAKARNYRGSRPENSKPVFSWDQQVSRRSLFTLPPLRYEVVPSIREEACAAVRGCRVCATVCPHQALTPSDSGQMILSKAVCTGCGACVSLCPRNAIDLPGASVPQVEAQLGVLLDSKLNFSAPRGILFVCEKNASTLERLARQGISYPANWLPVEVPCLGMVAPAWIIQCLSRGAAAVGLLPCLRDDCRFGRREVVESRAEFCRDLLGVLGGEPEAVRALDPNDGTALARALESLPESGPAVVELSGNGDRPRLGPKETARAFLALAERYGAASLEHSVPHACSPWGVVEVEKGCTACGSCASACPTGALAMEREREEISLIFDGQLCVGCEACVPVCPERVVQVRRVTDLASLSRGKRALHRDTEVRCVECGGPVASRAMLDRISALLGRDPAIPAITKYCLACRGPRL